MKTNLGGKSAGVRFSHEVKAKIQSGDLDVDQLRAGFKSLTLADKESAIADLVASADPSLAKLGEALKRFKYPPLNPTWRDRMLGN